MTDPDELKARMIAAGLPLLEERILQALRAARAEEREACEAVAKEHAKSGTRFHASWVAATIRARGSV